MGLPLWRKAGRGIYIGRTVTVTVLEFNTLSCKLAVKAPGRVSITGPEATLEEHHAKTATAVASASETEREHVYKLLVDQGVRIGRGIVVKYMGKTRPIEAAILVDAPRHVSVSRDDFSWERHLEYQRQRETNGVPCDV